MSTSDGWYPVIERYLSQLNRRIAGLGDRYLPFVSSPEGSSLAQKVVHLINLNVVGLLNHTSAMNATSANNVTTARRLGLHRSMGNANVYTVSETGEKIVSSKFISIRTPNAGTAIEMGRDNILPTNTRITTPNVHTTTETDHNVVSSTIAGAKTLSAPIATTKAKITTHPTTSTATTTPSLSSQPQHQDPEHRPSPSGYSYCASRTRASHLASRCTNCDLPTGLNRTHSNRPAAPECPSCNRTLSHTDRGSETTYHITRTITGLSRG